MNHRSSPRNRALNFAFPQNGELLSGTEESGLFVARDGQICLQLVPEWEELLGAISRLGPLGIVTSHGEMRQALCVSGIEFVPMPGGNVYVGLSDAGSELTLDAQDWMFALAVEEKTTLGTLFGFQFFDHQGRGQMKILLANESNLDGFVGIAMRFGADGVPPDSVESDQPHALVAAAQSGIAPDVETVRCLWPRTRHNIAGRFFPGMPGVTRQAALRAVGHEWATPMEAEKLVRAILDARRKQTPLRCTLFNCHLAHSIKLMPRRLERCERFLHVFDEAAEFHVPLTDMDIWRLWHVESCSFSVDLLLPQGDRLGLIEGW